VAKQKTVADGGATATAGELTINTDEISSVLRRYVEDYKPTVEREEVGIVNEVGDGIARVGGLPRAMVNEMLTFPGGTVGLAMNLTEHEIGAVVLGEAEHIQEGDPVKQTGQILSVPVGDALLGRVVDALGSPIDGKGAIKTDDRRPLEVQAPGVTSRQPVKEPLQTGIKAIDAMTPIGRGQRELIIGDRQTGKTAIAIDAIINQRDLWGTDKQVKCIYVAVGQKASTVSEVVAALQEYGALEYTVVVNAAASDPAPFQYLAPYAGCAMGQHWMENGEHSLIIYDDLSKQAIAYRQLSLLLRRPPGREAYPGDVFYLHSRLLERAAKLSDENGGGSLTALPIIETKGGDVSAYIPTNVISITDGQIYLEADLFFAGVRPAINVGISVSRVGGNAQIKAMKNVAGRLRLDLAQYRALEAFAEFGSELDKASQAQLDRGARVVEIMKQGQYQPYPVEDQVISIWAATNGYLDDLPVETVREFESRLLDHIRTRHADIGDTIRDTGKLDDELADKLKKAVEDFKSSFADRVGTVETVAAEEGVPEASGAPAAESGDATTVQEPGGSSEETAGSEEEKEGAGS
jgi:F-type H+-transporting ATPase subunit alpha